MSRAWDAALVSEAKMSAALEDGWEPLGASQITMFDRLSGQPIGAQVMWAMRRRAIRVPAVEEVISETTPATPVKDFWEQDQPAWVLPTLERAVKKP